MEQLLQKVYDQQNLSKEEMNSIATAIFEGQLSKIKIAAFLMALKAKGETAEEMVGIAEVMKQVATQIDFPAGTAMDNCGTGGDKSNSFNISTTAAFVIAASGIPVAKIGNGSISSRSGSADVCKALGIDINMRPEDVTHLLENVGIAFLYAPHVHPNMKYVMDVRKELGTPTIFNLIGPLSNPVQLETQLMGIYRRDLLEQTAKVLGELGRKRALVINGAGYMDEASLAGENHFALYENGEVSLSTLNPADVGLPIYPQEAISGGDAKENAAILRSVLDGEPGAYLDTVLLNAGFGLFTNGKVNTVKEGVELARELIESGAAKQKLTDLIAYQKEVLVK
ncbi:anthranilate phosphoribosyltransferase [Listeria seeligeri]|uniref:anthranilate phosphoribosyltransferase n=1 Tax=Listeria seeligeri TaxID=1640 RepID=UPI0018883427|nr:anthranilate phosphoribosyltransferase [Listeria seeligeri]MBF2655371.1 anthranilate phosphoribosyltransferase [Listeria seeligeri]